MAKRTCSLDDCERKHYARGWCKIHYYRWHKTGSTDLKTVEDRFWSKVDKNGPLPEYSPELGPCWLWTAPLVTGGLRAVLHGRSEAPGPPLAVRAHQGPASAGPPP